MDYIKLQQMLKQAASQIGTNMSGSYEPGRPIGAFVPDADRGVQPQVYTDIDRFPGGHPASIIQPVGSVDGNFSRQSRRGRREHEDDPWYIGSNVHKVEYNENGGNPYVTYRFPAPGTKNNFDSDKAQEINIDPTRLPEFYAGMRLLEPSYARFRQPTRSMRDIRSNATRDRVPLSAMPFTNEQLYEIQTGDPDYLNKRLAHLYQVPEQYLEKGNVTLSSPEEIVAWRNTVPAVTFGSLFGEGGPSYSAEANSIFLSPDNVSRHYDNEISDFVGNGKEAYRTAYPSFLTTLYSSASWPGSVANSMFHELGHRNLMGGRTNSHVLTSSGEPLVRPSRNITYDPNNPYHGDASRYATPIRTRNIRPLLFTEKQLDLVGDHGIEPYAVIEDEINQALTSMNKWRYALKRNMINEPDNPNYRQIKEKYPEAWNRFMDLPDNIGYGKDGRQQFDDMMQLFIDYPVLQPLIPEASRLVGHYQNFKAAVDNAKTPEAKQYLQNLMDMMIYDKSFLANNQQRPRPSYTDVQRMRA